MNQVYIFDRTKNNLDEASRGGGRIMQILKEALPQAKMVSNLHDVPFDSTLLVPSWQPFSAPIINKRYAKTQILMLFDVIPLLYRNHFRAGLKGMFNAWRNKRALKHFDKVITISNYSKKTIVDILKIPYEKVNVIYPAVGKIFTTVDSVKSSDMQELINKYHIPSKKYTVYVGDVNWNKNLVNLALAIKQSNIPCVFVGRQFTSERGKEILTSHKIHPWLTPYRDFLKIASGNPLFVFAGYVSDEELKILYHFAVCNTIASYSEGFGFSYVEAASQQTPSVMSDIEVFREIAGSAALFAHPDKPTEIASAIVHLAENHEMRHDLALRSFAQYETRSHPDGFAKEIAKILQ